MPLIWIGNFIGGMLVGTIPPECSSVVSAVGVFSFV